MLGGPLDKKPFSHSGRNGTRFHSATCGLKEGVTVTRPDHITELQFASDFGEFASYHAMHIWDRLVEGFSGYDNINYTVVSKAEEAE